MENQHELGRRDGRFVLKRPSDTANELPFQLVGAGCDFYQYAVDRPFGFPVFQWIQTVSGSGELEVGGRSVPHLWVMTPEGEAGHETRVELESVVFDEAIDDAVFRTRNLKAPLAGSKAEEDG